MTIHEQILKELNLKVGDLVKITHAVPNHHLGWANGWAAGMNDCIGKQGRVIETDSRGVYVSGLGLYRYPAQSIEVINHGSELKLTDDYTAIINKESRVVEVGCQKIPFKKVDELHKLIHE
jgi:hypothetical protein